MKNDKQKFKLLIISHVDEMIYLLKTYKWVKLSLKYNFLEIYQFNNWLLLKTGIGTINSAITLSLTLELFHNQIEGIIGIGSAGGIQSPNLNMNICDTFLVNKSIDLGANLTKFDYDLGILPTLKHVENINSTTKKLNLHIQNILKSDIKNYLNIGTSNMFLESIKDLPSPQSLFKEKFNLVDMESVSWIIIANYMSTPISIIKIVSDIVNRNSNFKNLNKEFQKNIDMVAYQINQKVVKLIEYWV